MISREMEAAIQTKWSMSHRCPVPTPITPTGLSLLIGRHRAVECVNLLSCPWTAVSNASWIVITSNSSGTGNGSIIFSVISNTESGGTERAPDGCSNTFTVTQLGNSQSALGVTTTGTGTGMVATNPPEPFSCCTVVTLTRNA